MDDRHFDSLARQLGRENRRGFLKMLLGIGGVVIAGRIGIEAASAAPKEKVSLCHAIGDGSFRLITVAENAVAAHLAHGDGYLLTDDHCSACGDACSSDQSCKDGACSSNNGGSEGGVLV